ncbi:acyl carrier protein [Salinisphaera japonica]|uniref:Thioester reductase n=1 Tax=Salinisphaera japonica YTM-1 TaxID=1209778 RepID=A0A423PJ44_9GAMM|nr:acyl carrier protein [Salinisphaera japonica]ROO25611.1 thioester reductase [Salinisphaera japonica YTM-1]
MNDKSVIQEPDEANVQNVELVVLEILESKLGKSVSRCDNFLDVGGNSLLAAELDTEVEQRFGMNLSMFDLFTKPLGAAVKDCIQGEHDA